MPQGTPTPEGHYVKRVVLPSGKTIDVVYFDPESARSRALRSRSATSSTSAATASRSSSTPPSGRRPARTTGGSRSAAPTASGSVSGVFPQDMVDRFDERLDDGTEQLVTDLRQLMRANMSEEIDRFVEALNAGALLPEDF